MRRTLTRAAAVALLLSGTACGQDELKPDPDNPQYKLGYATGQDDEKSALCHKIKDYKDSMAEALRDEGICP